MRRPKIIVFAGSIRTGSFNGRLAALAAKELALRNADVTRISLADYPLPLYDGDAEAASGAPENAKKLKRQFAAHHGIFIASPEYNASITPLLKNTLDWVSRVREPGEQPYPAYRDRVFALGAASNGTYGGYRSLIALRHVLELGCGAWCCRTRSRSATPPRPSTKRKIYAMPLKPSGCAACLPVWSMSRTNTHRDSAGVGHLGQGHAQHR